MLFIFETRLRATGSPKASENIGDGCLIGSHFTKAVTEGQYFFQHEVFRFETQQKKIAVFLWI